MASSWKYSAHALARPHQQAKRRSRFDAPVGSSGPSRHLRHPRTLQQHLRRHRSVRGHLSSPPCISIIQHRHCSAFGSFNAHAPFPTPIVMLPERTVSPSLRARPHHQSTLNACADSAISFVQATMLHVQYATPPTPIRGCLRELRRLRRRCSSPSSDKECRSAACACPLCSRGCLCMLLPPLRVPGLSNIFMAPAPFGALKYL